MYLCEACKEGDLSRANQLVRDGYDLEERSDYEHRKWKYNGVKTNPKSKCTPLMIASSEGHLDIVRELIRARANVHVKDRDDWGALHFACSSGFLEIVRLLLDNGCRLEEENDQKMTPLALAAFFGHSPVISEILERYKILEKDLLSALHWAYSRTQVNCVEILLPHVSLVSVERPEAEAVKSDLSGDALLTSVGEVEMWLKDFEEKQLCRACRAGNVNTVEELIREGYTLEERIEYVHKDWCQEDDYKLLSKYPPIMIASFEGHLDIVEMLVSAGALLEAQDSRYGYTALHCACANGSLGIVHLLLANNVSIDVPNICISITPFHLAAYFGHKEVLSLLLQRGANVNAKSKKLGRTALHFACQKGKLDCVEILLDTGSAINVCDDDDDWTPLILATFCGQKEVLSLLLQRGGNVDAKSKKLGRTALHWACREGKLDCVEMLLDAGSAINVCDDDDDWTPLILATFCGQKEVLSLLLQRGGNVDAKSKKLGRTALHWACREGKLDCVEMLLDAGSAINVCDDDDDWTPLILATFCGQKEVLCLLLQRGARIDAKSKKLGRTALHFACKKGKLDCVEMLLDAGSAINVCDDDDDWTPLILATFCGQKEVLSLLLQRGARIDAKSKKLGRTALHFACKKGKLDCVEMLLDAGSAINVCDDDDDWTPLILATFCGQKEVLSLLLQRGCNVDAKSKKLGRTALHWACREGKLDCVEMLLNAGSAINVCDDDDDWTPLILAAFCGQKEVLSLLLQRGGNVDAKSKKLGRTALHWACREGKLDCVEMLLDAGSAINVCDDDDDWTPLILATFCGQKEVLSLLLQRGGNVDAKSKKLGRTALHFACQKGKLDCVEMLLDAAINACDDVDDWTPLILAAFCGQKEVLSLLLQKGANVDAKSKRFGRSALHFACQGGKLDCVEILLDAGSAINVCDDDDDFTPLILATFCGQKEVLSLLLQRGALVDAKSKRFGRTALHWACQEGKLDCVEMLLDAGSAINVCDDGDWTPLILAAFCGQKEVLSLLLQRGCNVDAKSKKLGHTALHFACQKGKLDCVEMLLDAAINACDDVDDLTPLMLAAFCGQKEVLSLLLQRGALVDAKSKELGRTALHFACQKGKPDCVEMLLDAGSAINVCDDDDDWTPLILATFCGQKEVLSLLLQKGCNVDAKSKELGRTALHFACQEGKLDCVEMLLDAGSAINVCDDDDDWTPLVFAAVYGQKEVLSLLLKGGALIDAKSKKLGRTALHFACQEGKLDCVEMLLDAGSAINVCDDDDDWTPLVFAAFCGQKEVLSLLLKGGALIDAKSKKFGRTALHFACQEGKPDCVEMLLDAGSAINVCDDVDDLTPLILAAYCGQKEVLSLLLQRGCNVDAKSKDLGRSALHFACQGGKLDCVEILLDAGSAINVCDDDDDWTPLILATFCGQKEVLSLLLKRGANVDAKSKKFGRTALYWACQERKLDCVEMLLDAGSAINVCDDDDCTPLVFAAFCGQKEVLSLLLQRGANVDAKNKKLGCTALHVACKEGKLDCVEMLLDAGSAINVCDDDDDFIPLILAAFCGQKEVLSLLLQRGAIVDAKSKELGRTALHFACQEGKLDCVEMLLDAGSAINVCDDDDWTPLVFAAFCGQREILSRLLQRGAVIDAKSKKLGRTALHFACDEGKLDCVEMLLDAGSAINVCDDDDDWTPLILATFCGQKEVLSLLLKGGALINAKSKKLGRTALHFACQKGKLDCVEMLLDAGSAINVCDDDDWTPLILAAFCGQKEVISLLLHKGGNVDAKSKKLGRTALHWACDEGKLDCVEMLLNAGSAINVCDDDDDWTPLILATFCGQKEVLSRLLKGGALIDAKSKKLGRTALHFACQKGKLDCVEMLLDTGSAINVCDDDDDWTPLILAAFCGQKEVLSLLLQRGGNVDAKSKKLGRSALHWACREGKLDCVEMLLDAGSAINVCDDDDWTPLILAAFCGQKEVISLLLQRGAIVVAKCKRRGRTALHWAVKKGKLDCVEAFFDVLIGSKSTVIGNRLGTVCHQTTHFSNFLVLTDKQGLTPFHIAFRSGHINIVRKLLMYCCGLKLKSLEKKTISQLYLLKKKTIRKTIVYTESLRKVVCLIGNSKRGKSTLVSALQKEPKNIFKKITGRMSSVETITDRTAGIEMVNFESIIFGETLFFDFAGQHEYHGAHQAILKSLLTQPGVSLSIIIIVKLTDKEDAMLVQMTRWLQPLSWIVSSDVVHVNVVGSFADKVERSEAQPKLERCCQTLQNDNQYSNLKFDNFICLDCRKPVSSDIETLRNSLRVNTPPPILPKRPYNIHWVLSLLTTTINLPIISMQEFEKWLTNHSVDLPINLPKVDILSQELSATGNVLYISGQKDKSWLVIKLSHVLHDIYGQLYSRFQAIANNKFGLLHIKQLEELLHKSDLDIDAIVNLLISLDFCHLVDPKTLKDEIYHLTSTRDESGWLFFPSFITAKPDLEMFWRANQDSCSLCWQVSTSEKQFFSPQLLQTVLLRLAANHVFKHERTQSIQDHCCNFWYNGITWQTTDGVDVMVHIFENTVAQVIAVIPRKVDPSVLVRYMSSVTTEILYTVHQLYPKLVPYLEAFIIHTMDCKKLCDDPKSTSPSDKFLLSSIITSVIDNKQFCLSLKEESGYSEKLEVTELFKGFRPSPEVLHSMNPHTICIKQDYKPSVLGNATANSKPSISSKSDKGLVERTSSNKGNYVMTFAEHLIILDNDVISFRVNCSY